MSISYKKLLEEAAEYDKSLKATDKRLQGYVHLVHQDGSTFYWASAFLLTTGDFWVIFTEHHGFHVYHKDDVLLVRATEPAGKMP